MFNHIDINLDNTFIPNSLVSDDKEAMMYDELIEEKGGIDLQILGLGSDGHIGFNEPRTPFSSLTHIQELNEKTIIDNSRFFDNVEDVPTKAVTMGLKSIMNSRQIILIIYGENKKQALNDFIYGDIPKWLKGLHSKCSRSAQTGARVQISASPPKSVMILMSSRFFCYSVELWKIL